MVAGLPPNPLLDPTLVADQAGHRTDHEVIAGTLNMLKALAGMSVADLLADTAVLAAFAPKAGDRLWVPASDIVVGAGAAPTFSSVSASAGWPGWLMSGTTDDQVRTVVALPDWWTTFDQYAWWSNNGAGSGNVRFTLYAQDDIDAGDSLALGASIGGVTAAAPAQDVVARTALRTGVAAADGMYLSYVERSATAGADTLANAIALLGFEFVRAT